MMSVLSLIQGTDHSVSCCSVSVEGREGFLFPLLAHMHAFFQIFLRERALIFD